MIEGKNIRQVMIKKQTSEYRRRLIASLCRSVLLPALDSTGWDASWPHRLHLIGCWAKPQPTLASLCLNVH